jgi:uncharacterized protein YgiM (DUF1202 family)
MKTNCWLILGMMIAANAVAQSTNTLPPIPAPVVTPAAEAAPAPAPAAEPAAPEKKAAPAKHHKKHVEKHVAAEAKKVAFTEPTVTLLPGTAEVEANNLNVRGQAGLKGEVIAHVAKGEMVTVLSQINLDKHKADEPAQWAKIALPASTHVWVFSRFIDAANKTVTPKKLNLRAGPGENFSVLGVIEQGATVNPITTKGEWTQIEAPSTAYAFIAAMYLKQEASGNEATNPMPSTETEPTPTTVPETQPIVTEPAINPSAETNAAEATAVDTNTTAEADTNLPPRIVSHEGTVRGVGSLIAPTAYLLYDPATLQNIDFLYSTSTNLDLSRYDGYHIVVTGEEGLAKRWHDTPVLTVQSILVLSTNATTPTHVVSPRAGQRR